MTQKKLAKLPFVSKYDTKNIHRFDKYRLVGWWLKIQRNGKKVSKFFRDAKYFDNAECSLLAAIHERDEFIRSNPKIPFKLQTQSSNITGINGISFASSGSSRGAFVATWRRPDGRNLNKRFGVHKYGFHGALSKAIEARRNWEEEVLAKMAQEAEDSSFLDALQR